MLFFIGANVVRGIRSFLGKGENMPDSSPGGKMLMISPDGKTE